MRRSNIIGLIGAILGVAVIISILSWFFLGKSQTLLQGETDAKSYKASSKVPGRIDKLYVVEGQTVKKGDLLYELSTPDIEAKLQQARGAQAAAAAQERKAYHGARIQDIESARELWSQAEAGRALAQKSYDRAKSLFDQGVIAAQKMDEADANLKAMTAQAAAAKSQYNMALEGARSEDRAASLGLAQQAAGAVAEAQSYLDDAKVYAPADGEVSSVIAEQGELVGTGYPVVTIIELSDLWVTYNIKETLMPRIEIGKKFPAYVPALDREVEFVVEYISPQADFATWSATRTQGSFDVRTFKVKTRPTQGENRMRPGMSVIMDWDKLK